MPPSAKGYFASSSRRRSGTIRLKAKIFFLTLQPQRLRQFTLFIKQAIRLILGAIDPMRFSHHLDNGGCRETGNEYAQDQLRFCSSLDNKLVQGNLVDIQTHDKLSLRMDNQDMMLHVVFSCHDMNDLR